MSAVTTNAKQIAELEQAHRLAIRSGEPWPKVWQMFCENEWFNRRLEKSARKLVRSFGRSAGFRDDVKQEALLDFARSVQRDVTLGYESSLGSYGAFLTTIISRSCRKGLRQFHQTAVEYLDDEFVHPTIDPGDGIDERIDLRECLRQLPQPYRKTVLMICDGISVRRIAIKTKRSERTVYRWLEKATELLREILELDDESRF